MAADNTRSPILSLDTLSKNLPIKIDGKAHEIRHPDSLPLAALMRVEKIAPRCAALLGAAEGVGLTDEETDELTGMLELLTGVVLDAPADVRARLNDAQRVQIMQVFTQLRTKARPSSSASGVKHPAATKRRRRPSGAKRSRG